MMVKVIEVATGNEIDATISIAGPKDAPLKKDGWNFNWRELINTEGSSFFKLSLDQSPGKVQGLLMLSIYFDEMVFMNNLELAPHNIGKAKRYDRIAGCLIAYGCRFSMEQGKGDYQGFLTFESKTELIPLYEEKYGATRTLGQKMFISYQQGEKLIEQYLNT